MSKTISLKNITQQFAERTILDEASFKCTDNEKICIVGENGAGKSTLLKIISGVLEPTEGALERNTHLRCHYIPQEFDKADFPLTIEAYITKYAGLTLFKKTFELGVTLGFNLEKAKEKECGSLSGGQQKILALSVGLAISPDFLLMDEPENHLDIVSRLELMSLLGNYRAGVLFVSHDRMMIDAVADKVAEVAQGKIHISEGGYQDYIDSRLARIGGMQRAYDTESKRIKSLESAMHILQKQAFRGKNTSMYHRRMEELNALKQKHKEELRPEDRKTKISLSQNNEKLSTGKLLCRVEKARFAYEHAPADTFRNTNLEVRAGRHIILLGRNGSGKSTFLKCLTDNLPLSEGTVKWADGVTHAYFDQHAEFDPDQTPIEVVMEHMRCDDEKARSILGLMRFSKEKGITPIKNLSGGERMRVRFSLVFGANPDFLILDEPTNHLDEGTWQILLDACNASKSTILLVTHDYEFIESLDNKVFWLIHKHMIQERHKDLEQLVDEIR